ncbi:indolepyruvate ferredoxin oxidoreductase [Amylibacter kogurei]|uniref:Indolepyruvate ferredoxin oxidoreductase n=1 Tax=Paramylibacter kogurei TaxID=1889778 RepID=A0A2G5K5F5_9RHOB|nr:biopolymer transporter ExbD [Amylibacter kogurei]PIB24253.1 indolepyruvate ferredoxin oxidoreductase [Amylibacter kogurei]
MEFAQPLRRRRRPSLTPMIDVVFLLLVFFMLASQFGKDQAVTLPILGGDAGAKYTGPPRLITVMRDQIQLNGATMGLTSVIEQLQTLTTGPDDIIVLRGGDDANAQDMLDIFNALQGAGFSTVVMVE